MHEWSAQKPYVIGVVSYVVLMGILYFWVIRPAETLSGTLKTKNARQKQLLKKYFSDQGWPLSATENRVRTENRKMQEDVQALMRFSGFRQSGDYILPTGEARPRQYFSVRHTITRDDLHKLISSSNTDDKPMLEFPESLGFSEDIINMNSLTNEAVPGELLKLNMARALVELASDAGIVEIAQFVHQDPVIREYETSGDFVKEYPLHVEMLGNIAALMRFLHGMKNGKTFFAMKHIKITPVDSLSRTDDALNISMDMVSLTYITPTRDSRRKAPVQKIPKTQEEKLIEELRNRVIGYK